MKKKELKEIALKSIVGFPVGTLLLMIAYVCIYFIEGQTVFENEMEQLKNVNILIKQILISGTSWYVIALGINVLNSIDDRKINSIEFMIKLIITIVSFSVYFMLNSNAKFSSNVEDMNIIILVVMYMIIGLANLIKKSIEHYLINKKIKEINKAI